MSRLSAFRGVPLPKDWSEYVKLAVIHSIALAHRAITYSRSFAIVERLIRSMKNERSRRILVPLGEEGIRKEITLYINWYNQHRPHQALGGRIPMDVYYGIEDDITRFETRGKDANSIRLVVTRLDNRQHLPIVELKRAA